jgi:di/tripeptidase
LINEIRLQTFNSDNKKIKKKGTLGRLSKNFEKKINEINNKDIKNSLFQLFNVMKND